MNPVERIRKLLALRESNNPHEAAAAHAEALRMMARHGVNMSDLEPPDDFTMIVDRKTGFSRENLAWIVAQARGCTAYVGTRGIAVRGRRAAAEATRELYLKLQAIPDSATLIGAPPDAQLVYRDCFWHGFVSAVGTRLKPEATAGAAPTVAGAAAAGAVPVVVVPYDEYQRTRAEAAASAQIVATERLAQMLAESVAEPWSIVGQVTERGHAAGKRAGLLVAIPLWAPPAGPTKPSCVPRVAGLLSGRTWTTAQRPTTRSKRPAAKSPQAPADSARFQYLILDDPSIPTESSKPSSSKPDR